MTEQLYGMETNYVDWHHLLLCAALPFPWPLPTAQDLLEAWRALVTDRNTVGRKMVDKEHYMTTEMWLEKSPEYKEEMTGSFDRNHALKNVGLKQLCILWLTCQYNSHVQALFDMFCEEDGMLDVKHLLLYLCADPYPKAGLFKALSVVTGSVVLPHQVSPPNSTVSSTDTFSVSFLV